MDEGPKSKDTIRKEVWRNLKESKVTRFPGVKGRIPNFIGAESAARRLCESRLWKKAKIIKINPDSPQRAIRQKALEEGKTLYMAVPRLREEKPFIEVDPKKVKGSPLQASSIKGADRYGRLVSLQEVKKIDLIVCGSVAVNKEGARIGKGGGYSDIEYAILREEGKVDVKTPIITTVHRLQILSEPIPMTEHDIPLNAVATDTEFIIVKNRHRKPTGIYWQSLEPEKIEAIPILQSRMGFGSKTGQ